MLGIGFPALLRQWSEHTCRSGRPICIQTPAKAVESVAYKQPSRPHAWPYAIHLSALIISKGSSIGQQQIHLYDGSIINHEDPKRTGSRQGMLGFLGRKLALPMLPRQTWTPTEPLGIAIITKVAHCKTSLALPLHLLNGSSPSRWPWKMSSSSIPNC